MFTTNTQEPTMSNRFAHQVMPNLRIITRGALVDASPERDAWAARMGRVKTGDLPTFVVGDIVIDGDMRSDWYGSEFVVTAVTGDLLTLGDTSLGGETVLRDVHRTFFDHAGRRWVDKTCDCPDYMRYAADGTCFGYYCPSARTRR
jgi:hypothetical protein